MKVVTNPNKEISTKIKTMLKENGNYCPCKLSKTPDNKCICKEFREQIERGELGECHCGLYIITETD